MQNERSLKNLKKHVQQNIPNPKKLMHSTENPNYKHIFTFTLSVCRGGTNTWPDLDKSGNSCAKPNPRYPTRSRTKVLILKWTCFFHTHCVHCSIFSMINKFLLWARSKNCCPIDRLATNWHIQLKQNWKNIVQLCLPTLGKLENLDPVLISC